MYQKFNINPISTAAKMKFLLSLGLFIGYLSACQDPVSSQSAPPYPPSTKILGVTFDWSTHVRDALGSDNWAITWGADDNQYSSWGDGGGFGGSDSEGRVSLGLARIEGEHDDFEGLNVWGGKDAENPASFDGKSYGIISIDGVIYKWRGPGSETDSYEEARLFYSRDQGATFTPADWAFTKEDGLIMPTILNFGKDYAGARDDFVYHYFIELQGDPSELGVHQPGRIHLLRVEKDAIISSKSAYEYFSGLDRQGDPIWSKDIDDKKPVFEDPNGVGWNLAVSYNAGLASYLLTTEHDESAAGNLGIFEAPEPWGPWSTVAYFNESEGTQFAHEYSEVPATTFFWNFSNKWLSPDGRDFTLIFTGTEDNDSWNSVRGSFTVAANVPTTLYRPIGLEGISISESQIDLKWRPSSGPQGGIVNYNVYRNGELVGTTRDTEFRDTGLVEDTTYYYRVSAVIATGLESARSNPASVTTRAVTVPLEQRTPTADSTPPVESTPTVAGTSTVESTPTVERTPTVESTPTVGGTPPGETTLSPPTDPSSPEGATDELARPGLGISNSLFIVIGTIVGTLLIVIVALLLGLGLANVFRKRRTLTE
jgi:hypothetical protein